MQQQQMYQQQPFQNGNVQSVADPQMVPSHQPPNTTTNMNMNMNPNVNANMNPNGNPNAQFIGNPDPNNANNPSSSASPSVDVENSHLNPEVADFNPTGFEGGQAALQQTTQEQLFGQLQDINTQLANWRASLNSCVVTMQNVQTQLAAYMQQQGLLQFQQHLSNYNQLLVSQQALQNQINLNTQNIQQLEANAEYVRAQWNLAKEEQFRVDDTNEGLELLGTMGLGDGQVETTD